MRRAQPSRQASHICWAIQEIGRAAKTHTHCLGNNMLVSFSGHTLTNLQYGLPTDGCWGHTHTHTWSYITFPKSLEGSTKYLFSLPPLFFLILSSFPSPYPSIPPKPQLSFPLFIQRASERHTSLACSTPTSSQPHHGSSAGYVVVSRPSYLKNPLPTQPLYRKINTVSDKLCDSVNESSWLHLYAFESHPVTSYIIMV